MVVGWICYSSQLREVKVVSFGKKKVSKVRCDLFSYLGGEWMLDPLSFFGLFRGVVTWPTQTMHLLEGKSIKLTHKIASSLRTSFWTKSSNHSELLKSYPVFFCEWFNSLKSLMAMPSKAYRWSQPAKTLAVLGMIRSHPNGSWFTGSAAYRPTGQQNTCCGFLSPPKKKHLSWFRKNGRGCNNKNKAICFRLFFVFQVDGCVSHLCETPACHGPEHGLEQFSERQEHLGRDGNGRVVRVSAFRSFVFQITGGVEDAHVVH